MLKGMKGYQLTADDREFLKRLQEERVIKKYQEDLEDVQRLLKKETMALEMAHASRRKAEVELGKFPSCEELTQWLKAVLEVVAPTADLTDLDTKSLLAVVTAEDARAAVDEKKLQLVRLEAAAADRRKKEAEMRGWQEKQIANEQLRIQGLMSQLSDLTSELAQQEEIYKSLQMQIKKQEESGADAEKEEASDEVQAKGQVQRGQKEKRKGDKSAEKVRDAPKQNKERSTRNKRTDAQSAADDGTSENVTTAETKPKSEAAAPKATKSVKASRGSQQNGEGPESGSRASRAARGGARPPGATAAAASQPRGRRTARSEDAAPTAEKERRGARAAAEEEEEEGTGLRRSRRIASRRGGAALLKGTKA
ncbi:uncharacterized protein LOC114851142 isoform X2 [Betta splendens]|nr:uncharacterized protein LOC114851142 isoform X2 [Betta splendens]